MQQYIKKLPNTELFKGIADHEMPKVLHCLTGNIRRYAKSQFILLAGHKMPDAGVILEGRIQITQTDSMGNRLMLAEFGEGEFFSLKLSGIGHDDTPLTVMALETSSILFLDCQHILNAPKNCLYHTKLADNLLRIMTASNKRLNHKISVLSRRTIREKVMTCLAAESARAGGGKFTLKFNRQELADFLCVDRSALSRELSRLKNEGLISFTGKTFELL